MVHIKRRRRDRIKMMMMPPTTTTNLLLSILLLILLPTNNLNVNAQSEDYFCGTSWSDAAETCPHSCPTGEDSECIEKAGDDTTYGCFFFTGCWERIQAGEITQPPVPVPTNSPVVGGMPTQEPTSDFIYPTMVPTFGYTLGIQDVQAELIFTLDGVTNTMKVDDMAVFLDTITTSLGVELEKEGVTINNNGEDNTGIEIISQMLGFSFDYVDITLSISATYQPKPNSNNSGSSNGGSIYKIAKEYIGNKNGGKIIIAKLKMAGLQTDSSYFDKASSLTVSGGSSSVVGGETVQPSGSPLSSPTDMPTSLEPTAAAAPEPTSRPTQSPALVPTNSPSISPTRGFQTTLATPPLNFGSLRTAKSFGYIFNVRSTATSAGKPIVVNGFDFYTITPGMINYELWSKLGSYMDSKGTYDEWDLISSGTIKANTGPGGTTVLPSTNFTHMEIPGGGEANGGIRAFYITLTTNDLIYRQAKTDDDTRENDDPDTRVHDSSPEIEMYEGEAVLNYPFPNPVTESYFYRSPMEFVGVLHYDREPGRTGSPTILTTGVPSATPTTGKPSTDMPTYDFFDDDLAPPPSSSGSSSSSGFGVGFGTGFVNNNNNNNNNEGDDREEEEGEVSDDEEETSDGTNTPTSSHQPSSPPTSPPNAVFKANIVMTLRFDNEGQTSRIMFKEEVEALLFSLTTFFNDRVENTMTLEGLGLFTQEFVLVSTVRDSSEYIQEDNKALAAAMGTVAVDKQKKKKKIRRQRRRRAQEGGKVNALQLQVVLRVIEASLPNDVLGNLAAITIRDDEEALLKILEVLSGPYPYFDSVTGVDVYAIDELIRPPTEAPIPAPLSGGTVAALNEEDGGGGGIGGVIGGVIVALLLAAGAAGLVYQRKRGGWPFVEVTDDDLEDLGPIKQRLIKMMHHGKLSPMKKSDSTLDVTKDVESGKSKKRKKKKKSQTDDSNRDSLRSSTHSAANIGLDIDESERLNGDENGNDEKKMTKEERKKERRKKRREEKKAKKLAEMEQQQEVNAAEIDQLNEVHADMNMEQQQAYAMEQQELYGMEMGQQEEAYAAEQPEYSEETNGLLDYMEVPPAPEDNIRYSMTRPTSTDNLKKSLTRPTSKDNLRQSMTRSNDLRKSSTGNKLRQSSSGNNLRKSLVDKEFEEALLNDDSERGNLRGSMRRSTSQNNLRGSNHLRKSLVGKEFEDAQAEDNPRGNRPQLSTIRSGISSRDFGSRPPQRRKGTRGALSQSMAVTSTNNWDLGLDDNVRRSGSRIDSRLSEKDGENEDGRKAGKKKGDEKASIRKSGTKNSSGDDLRGSGNKGSRRPGIERQQSLRNSDSSKKSDQRRPGIERQQSLRNSDSSKKSDPDSNLGARGSGMKGSSDNLRGSGNNGSRRPGMGAKSTSDRNLSQRPGMGARQSSSRKRLSQSLQVNDYRPSGRRESAPDTTSERLRGSGSKPRRTSDFNASDSNLRGSGNGRRPGMGARQSGGRRLSQSLQNNDYQVSKTTRSSPRNSITASSGEQRPGRRASADANDRRRLSQSMTVGRTSGDSGLRRSTGSRALASRSTSRQRTNSSDLRQSTTAAMQRGTSKDPKRRAAKPGISNLKQGMVL